MEPISILAGISASLELLKNAKQFFYPNKTINEALAISSKRMADDVGSLQEQLRAHRQVLDKVVEQLRADKDMIEKHNEVLIQLSEATQQAIAGVARLQFVSYCAIGFAVLSTLAAAWVWFYK